ncbi:MAG TPA: methyltransferase domain-containing protein [Roseiflexaceae bacterium]|nr:methyltransferase domain-containing protein [Roseiflexaceae bacterium]
MKDKNFTDVQSRLSIPNSQFYIRIIRWAFARFYREFAWTYDIVAAAVSGGRWIAWGQAALPYLRGQVLELGCGTGNLQRALARELGGQLVAGLDASPQMLAIARRKLAGSGQSHRLVRAVAQALPFPATSFDSIVATFPSEYIIDSATLAELRRVVRPRGRIVVALAASFGADGLYYRLLDLLYRLTLQRSPGEPPASTPESSLGQALAEIGFVVEERWQPVGRNQVHLVIGKATADIG